ncbi:MAG: hypothetical protein WC538_12335 [Thermoanaerobaculia bacterium]|jgi:hypothetical protein
MTGRTTPMTDPSMPAVTSRIGEGEWKALTWAVIASLLVVAFPYVHGFLSARDGWQFSGFVGLYPNDYHSYLAWMRQAQDGRILFQDLYTTEPHGRVFFHPLFWLMGTASRLTGLPPLAVWYLVQGLSIVGMMVSLYLLIARITDDRAVRWVGLGLVMTAGGFGFLTDPGAPSTRKAIDLWMPETNAFEAICTSTFTLPFSLALMLIAFVFVLRHYEGGQLRDAALAGLAALVLSTTHQYDMVVLFLVIGVHALLDLRRRWKGAAIVTAVSLPGCLYSVAVVGLDPVFSAHLEAVMRSPSVWAHAIGWGLPLVFALFALASPALRRGQRDTAFLATWMIVQLAILGVPLNFQRKLTWGVHVPICLLAALAIVNGLRAWAAKRRSKQPERALLAASAAILIACSAGNAVFYADLFRVNRAHYMIDYIPLEYVEAFRWLDANGDRNGVVLAPGDLSQFIPGSTGCTAFIGHWAQTLDESRKTRFVARLFGSGATDIGDREIRILRRNRVRYIVLDDFSRVSMNIPRDRSAFSFSRRASVVFQNRLVTIWRLGRDMDPLPWGDGRWDD